MARERRKKFGRKRYMEIGGEREKDIKREREINKDKLGGTREFFILFTFLIYF